MRRPILVWSEEHSRVFVYATLGLIVCAALLPASTAEQAQYRKPLWSVTVASIGLALSAEVLDEVVLVRGTEGVAALERTDGGLRWEYPTQEGLVVAGDSAVVLDSGAVLDLTSGQLRFEVEDARSDTIEAAAATSDTLLVHQCGRRMGEAPCSVTAYDVGTGQERWTRASERNVLLPSTAWQEVFIDPICTLMASTAKFVVLTEQLDISDRGRLHAVEIATGETVGSWESTLRIHRWRLVGDRILRPSSERSEAAVEAVDPVTGRELWSAEEHLGQEPRACGPFLIDRNGGQAKPVHIESGSTLAVPERARYFGADNGVGVVHVHIGDWRVAGPIDSHPGYLIAMDVTSERQLWRVEPQLPSRDDLVAMPYSFTVADGLVLFSTVDMSKDGVPAMLYALDLSTGEPAWSAQDVQMLGAGDGAVVGRTPSRVPGQEDPPATPIHYFETRGEAT